MNNRPECTPCCLRRILQAAEKTTPDIWLHRKILAEAMQELSRVDDMPTPAEIMHAVARKAGKSLGVADPYLEEKRKWIEETTGNADWIRQVVTASTDPFMAAARLSIVANLLDCELRQDIVKSFSLRGLVDGFLDAPGSLDNLEDFRLAAREAKTVLFIHATAGELFFDRLLIETLGKPGTAVHSVVREHPILAHATREDALLVGLDQVSQIIDPGVDCLGLPLIQCSEALRDAYRSADLIVAKGQAAFETLEGPDAQIDGQEKRIFFLLRVKCPVVARHLGLSVGDCALEAS